MEEAKEVALDQLGVDGQDAEFEVLEEPRTGLFGRTRGDARVRARVRPTQPRPKVERRDRKGRGKGPARSGDPKPKAAAPGADAAEAAAEAPAQSEASDEKPAAKAQSLTSPDRHHPRRGKTQGRRDSNASYSNIITQTSAQYE